MPLTAKRPIVERIAVEIFDRLKRLEAGRDDSIQLSEVIRPKRLGGWTPKHLQVVITQENPERNDELSLIGNPPAVAYDQQYNLRCHVMPSELDPTPVEEWTNLMTSEIIRTITSYNLWHTMGGLAIDTQIRQIENVDSDGSFDGANVPLIVTYRVSETDPFTVR